MYRRAMIFCIAAAAFATNVLAATGYSKWGVTTAVKAENEGTAIISPGTGYQEFTAASAAYTVNAAPGYDIKTVIVDGRGTTYKNPVSSYTKTFLNDRLLHTLVVYTTPERYDVTTSKTGSGTFSPTKYSRVPYGTLKTPKVVKIVPYRGWRITSVTDNGQPATITDLYGAAITLPTAKGVKVTYTQMTGSHALAAAFDLDRDVTAKIQPVTATEFDVSKGPVAIRLDAFRSSSKVQPLTYTWALTANPADGATLTADPDYDQSRAQAPVRLFKATKAGTYTVKLIASDGVISDEETITYNVINLKAGISRPCAHCHSDGSRKATDQFFGGNIGDSYMASGHASNPEGASCQDCHRDHGSMIPFPYSSCQNCHAPDKLDGRYAPVANHFAGHSTTFHGMDTYNDCGKCHNPHAATSGQGYTCLGCHGGANFKNPPHFSNISASYMSARASCSNCHATPGNITILKQWAESGHAAPKGEAWVHYDFKTRTGCVQCHTTTGFTEFLASGSTTAWGTVGDLTKEVLRCDGCHTSPTGSLRAPAAVAKTYTDMSGAPVTYPDAGPSNLCISCHSGTQSGAAVAAATDLTQNFANFNSHYMAAAGILYGKTGYEYQTTLFPGPHANVGITNLKGTGTNGPCVTCHMVGKDHKFTASVTAICASCHADMTQEKLDADKASFAAALKALKLVLEQKGIYYKQAAYPYFYAADLTTQFKAWGTKETLGAAFNFNLLNREAGAFAHNRQYALALVRDSIDWLDNNSLDGSGLSAIDALVTAGKLTTAERDTARAALAPVVGAGNVEKGDPVLAAAPGFSGSNTCQSCHMAQFTNWSNTLHNKPMKTIGVQGAAALVNDGVGTTPGNDFVEGLDFNTASLGYTNPFAAEAAVGNAPILSAANGKYFIQIGNTKYEISRAQGGNGKWKQRYYTKIGNGYYVLPVQYNEETKQYGAYNKGNWYNGTTPLFNQTYGSQALVDALADSMVSTAPAAGGATGGSAASSWENRCSGCHQTGVNTQYRIVGTNTKPEVVTGYAELNVGCEACHGPGAVHASTMRREDIKNPGRWITGNQTDLYRAQESCGRCHQRGEGKAQFSDPTFGTVKLHVEAPSDLAAGYTNKAVFPIPGERLLDFMFADLTNTKIWDTAKNNTRPYDGTTTFFPSYLASSGHHQQWEDMEQGMKKTVGGAANGMTCFTCHDPHAATLGGIRATMTVVSDLDGQTYTINTSAQDNTLCFSCHSEYNSFSNLDRAELAANNIAEMAAAVDNHVRSKYRANPILGTPAKRITVTNYLSDLRKDGAPAKYGRIVYKNGQCISCHMPATASSAATFLDLQGRKQGDIRSHTFATIWASQKNAENAGAPASAPSSCSGCHTTTN